MTTGCTLAHPPQPLPVAPFGDMGETGEKSDALRQALARVLRRRHEEGLTTGTLGSLGVAIGSEEGMPASMRANRLLNGKMFPDRHWDAVALWAGLTPVGLLRELAAELEREAEPNRRSTKKVKKTVDRTRGTR